MSRIENSADDSGEGTARLTLHSVRSFLTPAVYDNPTWKGLFYFARDVAVFCLVMAGIAMTDAWYFLVPLWILAGLSISSLFIVGHDAAHGALFKSKRLSWWIGQIAMLPSLHAYEQWVYGHNRVHHGHTIKMDGDFVWRPTSPKEYAAKSFYGKALHRLYWSRFGSGIYYMFEIWAKGMVAYTAPIKGALRDKLLMLVFALGTSAAVYLWGASAHPEAQITFGLWSWFKFCAVPFFVWNYTIGFAVYVHHIHDSIPWKRQNEWTPFYGQMQGTVNYHVPWFLNFFFHNIFIHAPHHISMRIPFYHLPLALTQIKEHYADYVLERDSMFGDYLGAVKKCKLFDVDAGQWLSYKAAEVPRAVDALPDSVVATN